MAYLIRETSTGTKIEVVDTYEEALTEIKTFEEEDRKDDTFEEGYYEIVKFDADIDEPFFQLRLYLKKTQKEICEELYVPLRTWQDWEAGRRQCPYHETRLIFEHYGLQ